MRIRYFSDIRFPLERANGVQTMETCHALAARGHQVFLGVRPDTVRPPRDPLEFYGLPELPTLTIDRLRVAGSATVRRVLYCLFAVERTVCCRSDVILTRDLGVASVLLNIPRWLRPPVVFESHGFSPVFAETMNELVSGGARADQAKRDRLFRREERVWKFADGYVATTKTLAVELESKFGPRENAVSISNGVRVLPNRRFGSPATQTSPVVLYAGHLYPWKGVEVLLEAVLRLPEVHTVIVGGHPKEGDRLRLLHLATSLGISDRVDFIGMISVSEVQKKLADADVLVLPTTSTVSADRYTSPLKLFEYLAAGKPIVASDLQSTREVLEHESNAILVTPSDADALADGDKSRSHGSTVGNSNCRKCFSSC